MAFFDTDPVAVIAAPLAVDKPSVKGGDFHFGCLALVGVTAAVSATCGPATGAVAGPEILEGKTSAIAAGIAVEWVVSRYAAPVSGVEAAAGLISGDMVAVTGTAACTARLTMATTGSVAEGIAPGDRETVTGIAPWVSMGWVSTEGGTVTVTGGTDGTVTVRDEMGILMGVTVAVVGAVVCAARPTEKGLGSPKFTGCPISVVS